MSIAVEQIDLWNLPSYERIERVRYDHETELLTVVFLDGTSAQFDPAPLVPADLEEIDWWRTASNLVEVIVPYRDGWFEIPWDVIRRHTDPEFAAYWKSLFDDRNASGVRAIREEPAGADYDR